MRSTWYNLFATTVTAASNMAALTCVRAGRIRGVMFNFVTTAGAAAGLYRFEVTLNLFAGGASGQMSVIGRTQTMVAGCAHCSGETALMGRETTQFVPCDVPIQVGDIINFGAIAGGTAAATAWWGAMVLVEES